MVGFDFWILHILILLQGGTIDKKRTVEGGEKKSLIEEKSSCDEKILNKGSPIKKERIQINEEKNLGETECSQEDGREILKQKETSGEVEGLISNEKEIRPKTEEVDIQNPKYGEHSFLYEGLNVKPENLENDIDVSRDEKMVPCIKELSLHEELKSISDQEQNSSDKENSSSDESEDGQSGPSGTDYVMSSEDHSSDNASEVSSNEATQSPATRSKKSLEKRGARSSSRSSENESASHSSKTGSRKKLSPKKHFCLYCNKPCGKLTRHLERIHSNEPDVARAMGFPKGSKARHTLFEKIRNKRDFQHNLEVLKSGEGKLVTKRRLTSGESVRDFLPCQHCLAFYRKFDLWKHERSCRLKKGEQKISRGRKTRVQAASARLLPSPGYATGECEEIINHMNNDDISNHIRNDPLICKYGNALSVKHENDKSQYAYIAQKMRELARFVVAVNELDSSVKYLHELCIPSRFELAIEGAKKVSGFDPSSSKFKTTTLVSKIGYSLKRAAEIAFGESRMAEDREAEADTKGFILLLDTEWNNCFSRSALASIRKSESKVVDSSSLTEDVIKLFTFVRNTNEEAKKELTETPNPLAWRKLNEAVLAEVSLFNKRRCGDIGKMLLQTYTSRKSRRALASADVLRSLTKLELELGDTLTRMEIEGCGGRKMLVVLTEEMMLSIDILIDYRDKADVPKDNPFIFARIEAASHTRASDCLRRAAQECNAKNPEVLTSRTMRKQVGIYCQLMSLGEAQLNHVVTLVGCDKQNCHKLSENPLELEELSKLLLKLDQNVNTDQETTMENNETITERTSPGRSSKKRAWTEEEQSAVKRHLSQCFKLMKIPGKKDCDACIAAEPDLTNRTWTDVKSYVHNKLQTIRRKHSESRDDVNLEGARQPAWEGKRKRNEEGKTMMTVRSRGHAKKTAQAVREMRSMVSESTIVDANIRPIAEKNMHVASTTLQIATATTTCAPMAPAMLPEVPLMVPTHPSSPVVPVKCEPVVPTVRPIVSARSPSTPVSKPRKKRPWSKDEQAAVRRQFNNFIKLTKVPGKRECDASLAAEAALSNRTWKEIKYYVHNTLQSMKRKGLAPVPVELEEEGQDANRELETQDNSPVYLSL